jgi:hypothetical protein
MVEEELERHLLPVAWLQPWHLGINFAVVHVQQVWVQVTFLEGELSIAFFVHI